MRLLPYNRKKSTRKQNLNVIYSDDFYQQQLTRLTTLHNKKDGRLHTALLIVLAIALVTIGIHLYIDNLPTPHQRPTPRILAVNYELKGLKEEPKPVVANKTTPKKAELAKTKAVVDYSPLTYFERLIALQQKTVGDSITITENDRQLQIKTPSLVTIELRTNQMTATAIFTTQGVSASINKERLKAGLYYYTVIDNESLKRLHIGKFKILK